LPFFPHGIDTLIEPFAGSAALSIAAASYSKAVQFQLNDLNQPLANLWRAIIHDPQSITAEYKRLWMDQKDNKRKFYDDVRDEFNRTHRPDYLLYLLARCVKASVRYNPKGEFNQSPDNRRLGRDPKRMADDIFAVSNLLRGRTTITSQDYQEVLRDATTRDLIYMDPPYQGVCSSGDPRYYSAIEFEDFMRALSQLNRNGMSFILSYDGRTGNKSFGRELPHDLELYRIEVEAGRSSQSTLLGGSAMTYESVYLSKALIERLAIHPQELANKITAQGAFQLEFTTSP